MEFQAKCSINKGFGRFCGKKHELRIIMNGKNAYMKGYSSTCFKVLLNLLSFKVSAFKIYAVERNAIIHQLKTNWPSQKRSYQIVYHTVYALTVFAIISSTRFPLTAHPDIRLQ